MPIIALSLVFGIPRCADVLSAISAEVVIDGAIAAQEARHGPTGDLLHQLVDAEVQWVPHEEFSP